MAPFIPVQLHMKLMNEILEPAFHLRQVHGRGFQSPHASTPLPLPGSPRLRHNQEDLGSMLSNCFLLSRLRSGTCAILSPLLKSD